MIFKYKDGGKVKVNMSSYVKNMLAKGLFVCKQARPDIQPTIALLCMRTKEPNVSDWNKLIRMMKYLNGTQDMKLTLSTENLQSIKWYVDMSFAVHPDFRSQTRGTMTFRKGAVQSLSKKQKLNTRSSTEAEQTMLLPRYFG